jgi:hypothetical protein
MSTELPSQPEHAGSTADDRCADEAIEAIVYDVHPALVPRASMAYPYGPPSHSGFQPRPQDIFRLPATPSFFNFDLPEAHADYVVPQRFGLAAILGMTTALAILFGCMRWLGAEPAWYLFYGTQSIVICIVQMFQGRSPRRASAIAGAIMGPLFLLGAAWFSWGNRVDAGEVLCMALMMVPCGAFLGYLNGTCAAGIFLVMDKLEQYFQDRREAPNSIASPPAVPAS